MTLKQKSKDSLLILKDMVLDFLRAGHSLLLGFLIAFGTGFLFELAGWWYLMLLAGGLAGFFMKKSAIKSMLVGFLAIAALWVCFFIYFMIIGPIFELTALITSILGMLETTPWLLIVITIVIGGFLGALGALNGTYIANLIYPQEKIDPTLKPIKD